LRYYKRVENIKLLTLCLSEGQGGLELHVARSIRFYQNKRINHHVILAKDTFLSTQVSSFWEKLTLLPSPTLRAFPLVTAKKIAQLIDQQKPDILHIHWNKDLPLAVLAKMLSHHKPKLFFTRHMDIRHSKHDFYHRYFYSQIDRYLTVTKRIATEAKTLLPLSANKIQHLYLGVANAPKNPINRTEFFEKHHLNPDLFTIGVLGRIEHAKGQHLAIECLAILHQQNYPAQLIIAGHVMTPAYLADLIQLCQDKQLTPYVCFIDFIEEPMRMMGILDTLVLTTNQETFGLVLVEAMRCQVPVIGSNAGGVPEIITHQETGLLFSTGDSKDLATQIKYLIDHSKEKEKLAKQGRIKADTMFDEEQHFEKLFELYNAALKDPHPTLSRKR
jgi:glycosyltransferase involved in cell wall biosynthesis